MLLFFKLILLFLFALCGLVLEHVTLQYRYQLSKHFLNHVDFTCLFIYKLRLLISCWSYSWRFPILPFWSAPQNAGMCSYISLILLQQFLICQLQFEEYKVVRKMIGAVCLVLFAEIFVSSYQFLLSNFGVKGCNT